MTYEEKQALLEQAYAAREMCEEYFANLCCEARISPVPMDAFVRHRAAFLNANEAVYTAMWAVVADTGMQILRDTGNGKKEIIDPK